MELGSSANVCEELELLDVIEATNYDIMPDTWLGRQSRYIDYHSGRFGRGYDHIYYDQLRRQKIGETSARVRAEATRVISNDLECRCIHPQEVVERTILDDSGYYHPFFGWPHCQFGT